MAQLIQTNDLYVKPIDLIIFIIKFKDCYLDLLKSLEPLYCCIGLFFVFSQALLNILTILF